MVWAFEGHAPAAVPVALESGRNLHPQEWAAVNPHFDWSMHDGRPAMQTEPPPQLGDQ
jgi:hypothetical protein